MSLLLSHKPRGTPNAMHAFKIHKLPSQAETICSPSDEADPETPTKKKLVKFASMRLARKETFG